MAIKFSDMLTDERFEVGNRRALKSFYEEVKGAVRAGELNLEGHSLPTTMNTWIGLVEPDKKPLAKDYDVVDFSIAEDAALSRWRDTYAERKARAAVAGKTVYMSKNSKEMLVKTQALAKAHEESLLRGNAKKEDVISALSDLQAAVYDFLATYDNVQGPLRLPNRRLSTEKVKVRKSKRKR